MHNTTNLLKASFKFIINNKITIVRYRKNKDGHSLIVIADGKKEGRLILPIHEKVSIAKISLCALNLLKAKNKFRYEKDITN